MTRKTVLSTVLAGILMFSCGTGTFAAAEDEIAYLENQRQEAEAGLAQAQAYVSSLEAQRQELEAYLTQVNAEYDELIGSVSLLAIEAAQKEEALKLLQEELEAARKLADQQYEDMKLRIVFMYEKGNHSLLEVFLSANSFADFLNRVENISQISRYDRDMLKKYEDTCAQIKADEEKVEQESAAINLLLQEKTVKQQEVQAMAAATRDSILSYTSQIEDSAEIAMFMEQIQNANSGIAALIQQAAEEAAAQEVTETEESQRDWDVPPDFDPDTDTMDSSSSSSSSSIIVEEEAPEDYEYETSDASYEEYGQEDYYEDDYYEDDYYEESSDSGYGTYLGNFKLTAYCNCATCCGTAGNATASGVMPVSGHTVAMAGVPFGTELLINGNVYTVEDLGTPYGHVDIYCDSHDEALSFGMQYADVYQLN